MPRIRSIHPDACQGERLADLSDAAERLWWRLQVHCDDEGRALADARLLAAATGPLIDGWTAAHVGQLLEQLADVGLVELYDDGQGRGVLAVVDWHRYQHPRKPSPSKLPPPPGSSTSPVRDRCATGTDHSEAVDTVHGTVRAVDPPERETGEGDRRQEQQQPQRDHSRTSDAPVRDVEGTLALAVDLVAQREGLPTIAATKDHPTRWLAAALRARTAEARPRALELIADRPELADDAPALADALAPTALAAPWPPPARPPCSTCDDRGVVLPDGADLAEPCPSCSPHAAPPQLEVVDGGGR